MIFLELYWALQACSAYALPPIGALVLLTGQCASMCCSQVVASCCGSPSLTVLKEEHSLRPCHVLFASRPKASQLPLKHSGTCSALICATCKLRGVNIPRGQTLTNERRESLANFSFHPSSGTGCLEIQSLPAEDILQLWAVYEDAAAISIMAMFSDFLSLRPVLLLLPWNCTSQYSVVI